MRGIRGKMGFKVEVKHYVATLNNKPHFQDYATPHSPYLLAHPTVVSSLLAYKY